MNINEAGIDIIILGNSTREALWSRGWDSVSYNQAREKVRDAKGSTPPPPTPSSCSPPQKKTRRYWLKMSHPNRTTFSLRYTVNVNEIFFAEKMRHSVIKSSRLRDRKKRTITGQSCRITKIYRDLDNSLRLFSAYGNKRGMGEGPHPVDYWLGGAILLLILD